MNLKKWLGKNIWIWSILGSALLMVAINLTTGKFSLDMLWANAVLASFLVLLSLGQMTVIASGDGAIDLSIQYTVALAAYVSSTMIGAFGLVPGLLTTLAACSLVGTLNGLINMYLKVPAMITSLAVGYITYSGVLIISSMTTGMPSPQIAWFTQQLRVFGASPLIFVAAAFALGMGVLLYRTRYGKYLHAVGQNRNVAKLAGVNIVRTVMVAFVLSSLLAGVAGILLGGYFGGASQDMGLSYLMTSVAATVIGGTSAAGGRSSVAGTVCGALMLSLIVAFLNLTRLPMSAQNIIQGSLLMLILVASVPKAKGRRA